MVTQKAFDAIDTHFSDNIQWNKNSYMHTHTTFRRQKESYWAQEQGIDAYFLTCLTLNRNIAQNGKEEGKLYLLANDLTVFWKCKEML